MELNSSMAIRNQKVYEPLKGKNQNLVLVDTGNISNLNKIFITIVVKASVPSRVDVSCRGNRSSETIDRMPLKVNGTEQAFNLVSIKEIGTYNLEFDCSKFSSGILVFQVGGTVNPLAFDTYFSVARVVVTDKDTIDDTSQYPALTNKLKTTFNTVNNQAFRTGVAKTLIIEASTLVAPPTVAPFAEIIVEDVSRGRYLKGFDQLKNASASKFDRTGVNGSYVRIAEAGKHLFYYDVSESSEIRINFGTTLLALKSTMIDVPITELTSSEQLNIAFKGKSFDLIKTEKVVADCYNNVFVFDQTADSLKIGYAGYDGANDLVMLNSATFPNLKSGSTVASVYVLPTKTNLIRICVVTNKGQVYHNYPHRSTTGHGSVINGDHLRFDESVIWDLPTNATARRHPSNDPDEAREGYQYFPYLPTFAYIPSPTIDNDNGYGNGGFPDQLVNGTFIRPRFYKFKEPVPNIVDNPFAIIKGGFTKKPKLSAFGVYQISGSRVCLFGTEDGGRSWNALYEFDSYVAFGNTIDTTNAGAYTENSFAFEKRESVRPTAEVKEPTTLFTFGSEVIIQNISNSNPAVVTTTSPHGMSDMNLIRLKRKTAGSDGFSHLLNESASATDPLMGNGVFLRVKRLTTTTFELHENLYSPSNLLSCRHIHYTHPLKDFIAFGTGETYPQGWLMLLDDRIIDGSAYVELDKNNPQAWRLNSATISAQRLCSFWMLDDDSKNPTVYLGSDNMGSYRGALEIEGRTNLPGRSSTGILKGKLADIDDLSKFHSVFDIPEPNIYCMNLNGILVAGFQLGSNAVSFDLGESWDYLRVGTMLNIAWVDNNNTIYFKEGYSLRIK